MLLQDINERAIPVSPTIDPLAVLADDARIAEWKNQGLPADKQSEENGAIITWAHRWPLIIDPQLQGKAWVSRILIHARYIFFDEMKDNPARERKIENLAHGYTRLDGCLRACNGSW